LGRKGDHSALKFGEATIRTVLRHGGHRQAKCYQQSNPKQRRRHLELPASF
jgi:hypothetical protein